MKTSSAPLRRLISSRFSPRRCRPGAFRGGLAVLALALGCVSARAAALTWDADPGTTGPQDGAGTWDTATNTWWDGSGNVVWDNATPGDAVFGVANAAAGAISLGTGVNVHNLTFNPAGSTNYSILNNTLTLVGTPVITVNAGGDATIGSFLGGTAFIKEGSGMLTLNPSANNTFSGTTIINQGTVFVGGNDGYVYINGNLVVNAGGAFNYRSAGSGGPVLPSASLIVNGGAVSNVTSAKNFYINLLVLDNNGLLMDAIGNAYMNPTNIDARSGRIFYSRYRNGITLAKSTAGTVVITNRPNSSGSDGHVVTMNAGTLIFDKTGQNANRLKTGSLLTLGGGTLIFSNNNSSLALSTENPSAAGTLIKPGASAVAQVNAGTGGNISYGAITRNVGGTFDVTQSGSGNQTTTTPNVNGILGGWATYAGANWLAGTTFAAYSAYQTSADPTNWLATDNVSLSGNPSANLDDMTNNSMRLTAAATVTLNSGQTLTLSSGGLLVTGSGATAISGGTLKGSSGGDLVVIQNSSADLTISSDLADNGGATSLTKSGSGKLILTGTDNLTGTNYLNGGVVEVSDLNKLASGPLVMNGGTVRYTGGDVASTRSITVNGLGALFDVPSGTTLTQSGAITGSGAVLGDLGGLTKLGDGTLVLTASNYYNGATVVSAGTLLVNGTNALNAAVFNAGCVTVNGGVLGGTGTIGGSVTVKSGGTLSPGASIGTLTIGGNLALPAGSTNFFEVTNAPGPSDRIIVQGNLLVSNSTIVIQVPGTELQPGTNTLIQYSGTLTGSFNPTVVVIGDNINGSPEIDTGTPGQVNLVLRPQVAITSQPADTVVSVGQDFTLTVGVTGTEPIAFQWYSYGGDSNNPPVAILDATNVSFTITNAQSTNSGYYSVVITNDYSSVTSRIASVFVGDIAPIITGPDNQTVVEGQNVTFTASVFGNPPPALQWRTNGVDVAGATGSSLTLNNVPFSLDGATVSIVATNIAGSATNSATLTVIVTPVISPQPASLSVNVGDPAAFTSGATGVPAPALQWYKDGVLLPGQTGTTLSIASAQGSNIGGYTMVASNVAGFATSSVATLTVYSTNLAATTLTPASGASSICVDTPLYVSFNGAIGTVNAGKVRIYNVASPATPVDILDLSSNTVVVNGSVGVYNVQPRIIGGASYRTFPVLLLGSNSAAIYPHSGVLSNNQTYYVTVDGGVFSDANGAYFAGITNSSDWQFTTRVTGPANPTNLIVAADNSGDFCTVQGAVDFVPANNTNATVINIRNGIYREIVFLNTKNNVTFRGQDRHQTVVTYVNNDPLNGGTSARPMFRVRGSDVAIENMTLTNATPKGGSQAEALRVGDGSKRFVAYQADFDSYQDTILINNSGDTAYFQDCHIQGDTDFIWGSATMYFTNCEILCLSAQSHVTQARTDATTNGIAFVNCAILRASTSVTNCDLGRDGGTSYPYGQVVYVNCSMDTNAIIPAGWVDGGLQNKTNLRFWEYQSTDLTGTNLIDVSQRASWSQQISYTVATNVADVVFWLYGWAPQLPVLNAAPVLDPISDQIVNAGATVSLTATASDPDVPFQSLTFSLATAPPDAQINPNTGAFQWRPPVALADTTNLVTVRVTDDGTPNLSALQSFNVIVNPLTYPTLGSVSRAGGQVSFTIETGTTGPDYVVWASTNLVNWDSIFTNSSPTVPFTFTDTNTAAFTKRFYRIQLAP